jgi:hypothetical protein
VRNLIIGVPDIGQPVDMMVGINVSGTNPQADKHLDLRFPFGDDFGPPRSTHLPARHWKEPVRLN